MSDGIINANANVEGGLLKASFGDSQPISVRELPDVTIGDAGKVLKVNPEGNWAALNEAELPAATSEDAGKILKVGNDGSYGLANETQELPSYSSADATKVLTVGNTGALEFANVPKTLTHVLCYVSGVTYDSSTHEYTANNLKWYDEAFNELETIPEKYSSCYFEIQGVSYDGNAQNLTKTDTLQGESNYRIASSFKGIYYANASHIAVIIKSAYLSSDRTTLTFEIA